MDVRLSSKIKTPSKVLNIGEVKPLIEVKTAPARLIKTNLTKLPKKVEKIPTAIKPKIE